MENGETEVICHSYDWGTGKDPETGYSTINCWGLNRESQPVMLRIHDFDAFCYVELPLILNNTFVNWEGYREKLVYEAICNKLGEDDRPHRYMFVRREKLYFFKGLTADGKPKTYPMLLLCFHSIESMMSCKRKLSYPFKIRGLKGGNDETMVPLRVWETNIPIVRKLLTLRDCKFSQWFKIKGVKVTGEDKISTLENEYVVDWKTLIPIPAEDTMTWLTKPTLLSFDIETYSDRHNAMPDPFCSKHVVYMISVVFQRLREPESRKTDIILFGDCSETKMANVIKVKTEMELIDTFQDLIIKYDPDIISGFNFLGYDNPFLETRLKRRMKEWKPVGRLLNRPSTMKSISWSSSAYKNQEFNILDMEGRISIDLLPLVRRDYKLPLYNLNFVANHFLKKGKHDVTAKQMFEIYELQICLRKEYKADEAAIPDVFKTWCKNKGIDNLRKEWIEKHKQYALDEMRKVVDYCVVDADLVVDLFEKINVWIGLISMSNIMGITPTEMFTRGTGVRMQSQIYNEASKNNTVLDEVDFPENNYEGGLVVTPVSGIYYNIPCLDFSSLYPSVMIAQNIDHKTCVPPELMDKIPDEMCNVIEWDEEIENEEDSEDEEDEEKEAKSPKKKTSQTKHYKYKFLKEPIGIMPKLLKQLIAERNKVRGKQKNLSKDSLEWNILEQTQLGIKIIANSFYGSCGSRYSSLRCPYISSSITAKARESTRKMNAYLEAKGYRIVYGDTDSTMPDVGITDTKTAWEIGEKLAKELSALFPAPMSVELEAIFAVMLSIKKKMYLCILMDKEGNPIDDPDKMKIRGVTLARRDNCKFQREFYKPVCWKVMHKTPFMDTFNFIVDKCIQLASHSVPWEDLTMIKGLGSHYKSASYMMAIFSREMEKSGNPIVAGDRIPYIVVKTENEPPGQKLGYKMRSKELFLERAVSDRPEHIDYLYYLEKNIKNGVEKQLFQIGYKKELEEVEKFHQELDRKRFLKALKAKGYKYVVDKLKKDFSNDKEKIIEYLREKKEMEKIVKPLYSFHIKRRKGRGRRLSSRVDKEPILMMVRIMRAKEQVMQSIRAHVRRVPQPIPVIIPSPEKRKLTLKILQ